MTKLMRIRDLSLIKETVLVHLRSKDKKYFLMKKEKYWRFKELSLVT